MTFVSMDEKEEILTKNKIDPDARNDFYNTICNLFWKHSEKDNIIQNYISYLITL